MKRALYIIIIIILPLMVSCTKKGIIPRDTLSNIYYDIYLADKYIDGTGYADTLLIYEPIFNKYGYTSEDYLKTAAYYLKKPEKFAKIYKGAQEKLKARKKQLERLMAAENGKQYRWSLLDSLDFLGDSQKSGNAYYRTLNLIFFVPDTIPVTSPTIDSTILNNPENYFFLYDSLTTFDGAISIIDHNKKEIPKDEAFSTNPKMVKKIDNINQNEKKRRR